jgi:hypothetical protein
MDENDERTLIFVDMLGFANLTEKFRLRVIQHPPDEMGYNHSSTSEMSNQFHRFTRVLGTTVFENKFYGELRAMLFSDCAFLDFGNSIRAALAATALMRDFVKERVPVRMGIGRGTFYPFEFSTEVSRATTVARALFVGTAVVRAHSAEQCGGKGLRIFVHPLVEPEIPSIQRRIKVMALAKTFKNASWELDYLPEGGPANDAPLEEAADRELFEAVAEMKDPSAPMRVRRHYVETLKALNRMRRANSKPPINIRPKKQASSVPPPC